MERQWVTSTGFDIFIGAPAHSHHHQQRSFRGPDKSWAQKIMTTVFFTAQKLIVLSEDSNFSQ
jgi:hypothetical protein